MKNKIYGKYWNNRANGERKEGQARRKYGKIMGKGVSLALAFVLICGAFPMGSLRAEKLGQQFSDGGGQEETAETGAKETGTGEGNKNARTGEGEPAKAGAEQTGSAKNRATKIGETDSEGDLQQVIEIATVEDFLDFGEQCSLDSWSSDKRVVLKNDIDLSGSGFEPIPIFTGTFDGGNHVISGFRYDGGGYVAGLFRYIGKDGVVENLNLEGEITASEERECIGSLCGVNYGTIRQCSFQGTVSGRTTVGGLVGVNEGTGMIRNSAAGGRVTGYYSTGGIVGRNHGTVSYCINRACINNDSQWVEEDDEMGAGLFLSIDVEGSNSALFSGVDTGGIAGYSDGTVIRSMNYGQIGYEHAGYNIGGIAGRQSGVVSMCTNNGPVYGRKDVGGIVGQMEPYIEVNEAESLRSAVNKLHDLIEKTLDDMGEGKNALKKDLDGLAAYGDGAVDAGDALADQMADFVDDNLDQAQAMTDRLDHVTEMLPDVFDDIYAAEDSFFEASQAMARIGDQMRHLGDDISVSSGNLSGNIDDAIEAQRRAAEAVDNMVRRIQDGQTAEPEQLEELSEALEALSDATATVMKELEHISGDGGRQAIDKMEAMGRHLSEAMNHLQSGVDSVKKATRDTDSIVGYVNGQQEIRFSKLGGEFDANREALHGQLRGISASIASLNSHASDYSDLVNADLRAVNDQMNVVFNLLADHLSNYGELSVEELYEDVDIEDPESIATGKTDNCTNKGIVKGDINVGGIAGAMSVDEEDPEDSAAGSVEYQIGRKYFTKCIVTDSVNEGYVTAKKDGAGGIVGYMRHGIVIDSEGYGSVESTEGNYVGGICGESLTVIRRCYALCSVSGGKNVGGIAGFADTLENCYAMADCYGSSGRKGAVAGQVVGYDDGPEEEGKVTGNYFVSDDLQGIDGVSYLGIAEPIDYESLLEVEGLPSQFRHLKVIYRVEDRYLGVQELKYGESLENLDYPPIPEREGFYGVWPDYPGGMMTGNLLVSGEYREDVTVVQSNELAEPGMKPEGESSEEKDGAETLKAGGKEKDAEETLKSSGKEKDAEETVKSSGKEKDAEETVKSSGKENPEGEPTENQETVWERPYALVEKRFTTDTVLKVSLSEMAPPDKAAGRETVVYDLSLEQADVGDRETFAVRLYNPYEKAIVWGCQNGIWTELESKERGHYVQVEMTGPSQIFCVAEQKSELWAIGAVTAGGIAALTLVFLAVKKMKRKMAKKGKKKGQKEGQEQ